MLLETSKEESNRSKERHCLGRVSMSTAGTYEMARVWPYSAPTQALNYVDYLNQKYEVTSKAGLCYDATPV